MEIKQIDNKLVILYENNEKLIIAILLCAIGSICLTTIFLLENPQPDTIPFLAIVTLIALVSSVLLLSSIAKQRTIIDSNGVITIIGKKYFSKNPAIRRFNAADVASIGYNKTNKKMNVGDSDRGYTVHITLKNGEKVKIGFQRHYRHFYTSKPSGPPDHIVQQIASFMNLDLINT